MSDLKFIDGPLNSEQLQSLVICAKLGHTTTPAVLVAILDQLAAETLRADTAEAELEALRYKAELYDEVWAKATGRGYMNVTMALCALTAAEQRVSELEKVLGRIARPHDCGCWPCMGSCVSQEALQITVDEMRDRAGAALNSTPKEESHE